MFRLKLVLAFIGLAICVAGVLLVKRFWEDQIKPEQEIELAVRSQFSGPSDTKGPDLGKRQFEEAVKLLEDGKLNAATDRLLYLMTYYPESDAYPEAKRIVGEINVDRLISRAPMEGKIEYTVKSGDALAAIARHNQCNVDYIMRANGRTSSIIHPGDRLVVIPLNWEMVIDLGDMTLTLERPWSNAGKEAQPARPGKPNERPVELFFKEYPIVKVNAPPGFSLTGSTEVSDLVAWKDGRRVEFNKRDYLNANKWIQTRKNGVILRPYREKDESGSQQRDFGIMLHPADLEELFTILRPGTPVTVVNSAS